MSLVAHIFNYHNARYTRLQSALQSVGVHTHIVQNAREIKRAGLLVLPDAREDGARFLGRVTPKAIEAVASHVDRNRPILAIGAGMLLLSKGCMLRRTFFSGAGVFDAPVYRFEQEMIDAEGSPLQSPHMGFSFVVGLDRHPVIGAQFPSEQRGAWFYFRHRLCIGARVTAAEVAVAHHGFPFAGAIWRDNIFACQFLPELSGALGLNILQAWCKKSQ